MDDLAIKSDLAIGTFANGKTMHSMQLVQNKIRNVRWLYNQILKNNSNFVYSMNDALLKVHTEPYAFIQEEPKNLYYSSMNCSLKTLYDQNLYVPGEYAIAFHHESPYIGQFDKAIRLIKNKGTLKRLIRKHFYDVPCQNGHPTIFEASNLKLILLSVFIVWKFSS